MIQMMILNTAVTVVAENVTSGGFSFSEFEAIYSKEKTHTSERERKKEENWRKS